MGGGNAAVQVVGRSFFRITMLGYMLSGLALFPSAIFGVSKYYFTWEMDRCSCVLPTDSASVCEFGLDFVKVDIGWKKYTIAKAVQTNGCPKAVERFELEPEVLKKDLDKPQTFGAFKKVYPIDGVFQKTDNPTQADESNGGSEAGGGVVAMQVVLSFFAIFTWKILKASYYSNGSHCSIGLGLMTRINFLMGLGTAAAIVSYWWVIEGRFGDDDKALTAALEDTMFNECWVESTEQSDCPARPWDFGVPGWAMWVATCQVGLFLLMTLVMFWKAPTVEGVLDGSMDTTGAVLKPRVVEVEMVVGKALATDGDPDYDSENPLYNGAATMIRPYPLPKSAKAAKAAAVEGEEAEMAQGQGGGSSTASSDYEAKDDPEHEMLEYPVPADLDVIVEESEEDKTSSRYSETRYSEASRYSDTYSDYGDRPSRGGGGRPQAAPSR